MHVHKYLVTKSGSSKKYSNSVMGYMTIWAKMLGSASISGGRSGNQDQRNFYGGLILEVMKVFRVAGMVNFIFPFNFSV